MNKPITIDPYDDDGVFVIVAEWRDQGPIVMETEGPQSSREEACTRMAKMPHITRACICSLVPVRGNELLILDMKRMQK